MIKHHDQRKSREKGCTLACSSWGIASILEEQARHDRGTKLAHCILKRSHFHPHIEADQEKKINGKYGEAINSQSPTPPVRYFLQRNSSPKDFITSARVQQAEDQCSNTLSYCGEYYSANHDTLPLRVLVVPLGSL